MSSKAILFTATLMAALSYPSVASADDYTDAFNAGMASLGKAQYDRACEHFSKAESIKGQATIKTRYQLGRCNEERKNFVDAHGYFLDAARLAAREGETKRSKVAYARVEELERQLPILVITVPEEHRIHGMTIELGDQAIPIQNWGQPIALEPGDYVVTVSAPNMKTITLDLPAPAPGQRSQLVIPALASGGPSAAGPPPAATQVRPSVTPTAPTPDEPETRRKNPALFWTGTGLLIGGGVAGLAGLGAYAAEDVDPFSPSEREAPPAAIGLWIAGGVMIGVGIPFMAVFGQKVPVDADEEAGDETGEETADAPLRLEPLIGLTSAGLRLVF